MSFGIARQTSPTMHVSLLRQPSDRFYRKVNEDNLALMRLDIEALVESASIDCEIWVAKAGDDGEIGSAAIFVPAGKSVGGTPDKAKLFVKRDAVSSQELKRWNIEVMQPIHARRNQNPQVDMHNGGHIVVLATHPSYTHQGLASAVVSALKDATRDREGKVMLVCQVRDLAERFYAPLGFEIAFEEPIKVPDGTVETFFAMVCDTR